MHLCLLAIGVFIGRALHDYPSKGPNVSSDKAPLAQENTSVATTSSSVKVENRAIPVLTDDAQAMSQDRISNTKVEQEALDLIAKFESFDQQAYDEFMIDDKGQYRDIELGRELTIALLNQLPTVHDARARERVNFLLAMENSRLFDVNAGIHAKSYIEEWLIDKVRQYDQRSVWLETLAQTGLNNIENIDYLLSEIPHLVMPEDRANILTSLESNMSLFRTDTNKVNAIDSLSDMTTPYLTDPDERIRAAAVGTLHTVRDNQHVRGQLLAALRDPSSLVQSKAVGVIMSQRLSSPEIKQEVLKNMMDKNLSALTRLAASSAVSVLPLNQQQRQQYAKFMSDEYPNLYRELEEARK